MTGRSVFLQTQEVNNLRFDTEVMDNNLLTFNLNLTSIDILISAVDIVVRKRGILTLFNGKVFLEVINLIGTIQRRSRDDVFAVDAILGVPQERTAEVTQSGLSLRFSSNSPPGGQRVRNSSPNGSWDL